MTESQTDAGADAYADASTTIDGPIGRLHLLPLVEFGTRASALARVALPIVVVTAAVAGGDGGLGLNGGTHDTSCCPDDDGIYFVVNTNAASLEDLQFNHRDET
jgi:hypothetical protein